MSELGPEVLWHLWDGVDTDSVEIVGLNEILDPVLEEPSDIAVFLVDVWEISQSTVLNLPLVTPVINSTVVVVVLGLVQRENSVEVITHWSGVVGDDVDHNGDAFVVSCLDQVLEVVFSTEVGVDLIPVGGPVSVITSIEIVDYWRNPDSVEAHTCHVIKVVLDTLPGSTAIVRKTGACVSTVLVSGKSVSKDLVDGFALPEVGVTGGDSTDECEISDL